MSKLPRITAAKHVTDYCLELTFSTGETAEVDFRDRIVDRGGVFTALEDIQYFRRVAIDSEAGTIVWPNGIDFCPDVLYSEATGTPLPTAEYA